MYNENYIYYIMYEIKTNYNHRKQVHFFDDTNNTDKYQNEIYKHAKQLTVENDFRSILDIGCGSGYKLIKYFPEYNTLGIDLPETVKYLNNKYPDRLWQSVDIESKQKEIQQPYDMVLAVDIIEHLLDPDILLNFIGKIDFQLCIISTPERDICRGVNDTGPPSNPCHVREWNSVEFTRYISTAFNVVKHLIVSDHEQYVICKKKV